MSNRELGIAIIVVGAALLVVGVLFYVGGLSWLGRLPGDLRFERGRARVFIPIGSMLLLSILLSLLLSIFRRFL